MRDAMRSGLVVLLLCLGAGCRLDPCCPPPEPGTPAGWRDPLAADAVTRANVDWFDLFQDGVLQDLVRAAIRGNRDLRAAVARVDEARALVRATGSELYPTVGAGLGAGAFRGSRVGTPGRPEPQDVTSESYRLGLDVSWEIDVFGRIRSQTAAQRALYFQSVEAWRDVGLTLVSSVALAYFRLRSLDDQIQAAEQTLVSRQRYVELARIRFEGEKTSELDLRQAEGEYFRTKVILLELRRQATVQENAISVLLGHASNVVPRGIEVENQPLPAAIPAGLPSDLVDRRPDVRAREQSLRAEMALVGAARANLYPRFPLTASYGVESADLSNLLTSPAQVASIVGGILQPIFNAGRDRSLVAAQVSRMRAAGEAYAQTLLVAFQEVEDALVSYRRYTEQREAQLRRVEALGRVLNLAEIRYHGGISDYLEVLDAQRELFDAELEESDTVASQLASIVLVYKALGGSWVDQCPGTWCAPAPTPGAPSPRPPHAGPPPARPPAARPPTMRLAAPPIAAPPRPVTVAPPGPAPAGPPPATVGPGPVTARPAALEPPAPLASPPTSSPSGLPPPIVR